MDAFISLQLKYNSEYIQTESIISLHIGCERRLLVSVLIPTKSCTLFPNVMIMSMWSACLKVGSAGKILRSVGADMLCSVK